jgi:bifunctional oligoribonuclease and PAP phosphatase NrnA
VTQYIDLGQLAKIMKEHKDKTVVLTFHSLGDRDGVGAAVALSGYFSNATVITPDFITHNARKVLKKTGYTEEIPSKLPKSFDALIVLDTNTTEQLGELKKEIKKLDKPVIYIDHHLKPKNPEENAILFDSEGYNSASSITYELLKILEMKIDRKEAILLLNGIISDSADFKNSTPLTFKQVSELLEIANISYSELSDEFSEETSLDQRYNMIKNIFNAEVEKLNHHLLVYGETTIPANAVADAAIKLGADASVFWLKAKEVSISARLRPPLDEVYNIHLGKIMQQVGSILDGNGGGHPCAAGAYGPALSKSEEAINKVMSEIKEKLSKGAKDKSEND